MAKWIFTRDGGPWQYPTLGFTAVAGDVIEAPAAIDNWWELTDPSAAVTIPVTPGGGIPTEPGDGYIGVWDRQANDVRFEATVPDNLLPERLSEAELATTIAAAVEAAGPAVGTTIAASVSGAYELDPEVATDYSLTLIGNVTLSTVELANGQALYVELIQDATGSRTVTLPAGWLGRGDVTIATTPGTYDVLVVWKTPLGVHVKQPLAAGEAPWSPEFLSGKLAWHNADDVAGDAGTAIARWENKWPERALGQATAGARPTLQVVHGVNVLVFDGGDTMSSVDGAGASASWASGSQPVTTVAFLAKTNGALAQTQTIVAGVDGAAEQRVYVTSSAASPASTWVMEAGTVLNAAVNANQWAVVVAVFNGASSKIRVNGVETTGASGAEQSSGLRVGRASSGSNNLVGQIAEVIVVSGVASTDTIADIEAYLGVKRAILIGA